MIRLFLTFALGSSLCTGAVAGTGFAIDPSGQATGNSCQSYALGVALAFKRDAAFPLDSAAALRDTELRIRAKIVQAANGAEVTHEHVKAGFLAYTGGRYKLATQTVAIAAIGEAIGARSGVTSAAVTPMDFFLGNVVRDVVLSSATKIENDSYAGGHIFTLLGVDGGPNSNQRFLVLNSAVKVKNMVKNGCSNGVPDDPGPYTASLSWKSVNAISFKTFNDKILLWTVEKN